MVLRTFTLEPNSWMLPFAKLRHCEACENFVFMPLRT